MNDLPTQCPSCRSDLLVSRLTCPACGTEVTGSFSLSSLARLAEPHASLLELFLRVRGNVKDMERLLGLSYPTVRARLEEALAAAGLDREPAPALTEAELRQRRDLVLDQLERGELAAADAAAKLRDLQGVRGA
jgi:hypothetical protein